MQGKHVRGGRLLSGITLSALALFLPLLPVRAAFALLPGLAQTPDGAVYFAANCVAANNQGRLVLFLPGTGGNSTGAQWYLKRVAEQTGLCTLAVNYENDAFVGTCCTTVPGNPDGPQDPSCHAAVLGSKAFANPVTFTCLDGSQHSVEPFQSILGRTTKALADLAMSNYLTSSGGESLVDWSKIVVTGHSQGALFSLYIARAADSVAGVGSIAGGAFATAGPQPYLSYVTGTPVTVPSRMRAFHHVDDDDAGRRSIYGVMRMPERNIRTTANMSPNCSVALGGKPHTCVISDFNLAFLGEEPAFVDDWVWMVSPTPGACPTPAPATVFARSAKLKLDRLGGSPGDDRLRLKASTEVSAASFMQARPDLHGARFVVTSVDGTLLVDAALPAGNYGGKGTAGWRRNGAGNKWTFLDKTAAPVAGIIKVGAKLAGGANSNVRVSVRGRNADYSVTAVDTPVSISLHLGNAVVGEGLCAEQDFTLAQCSVNSSSTRIRCRL